MTRHKHAAPSLPPHLRNRSCRCLELLKWGWHAVSLGGSSQSLPNVEIDNEGRVEVYFSGQILHCDSIPKSAKALARITKLLRHMDLGRRLHAWEHGAGHRDTPGIMTHIYIYIYILSIETTRSRKCQPLHHAEHEALRWPGCNLSSVWPPEHSRGFKGSMITPQGVRAWSGPIKWVELKGTDAHRAACTRDACRYASHCLTSLAFPSRYLSPRIAVFCSKLQSLVI